VPCRAGAPTVATRGTCEARTSPLVALRPITSCARTGYRSTSDSRPRSSACLARNRSNFRSIAAISASRAATRPVTSFALLSWRAARSAAARCPAACAIIRSNLSRRSGLIGGAMPQQRLQWGPPPLSELLPAWHSACSAVNARNVSGVSGSRQCRPHPGHGSPASNRSQVWRAYGYHLQNWTMLS